MKPSLDLYLGQKVVAITHGDEEWEWGIKLEGGAEIRNKSRKETFRPTNLIGLRMSHLSLSVRDTTIHFTGPGSIKITVGLVPTQYVICDPVHGGEVFPQWPDELEEAGITSHPDEPISDPPDPSWIEEERRLVEERDRRHEQDAQTFLEADESDSKGTDG